MAEQASPENDLNRILQIAVKGGASDIHIKAGLPPIFRVDGSLLPLRDAARLSPEDIGRMAAAIMSKQQRDMFQQSLDLDMSHGVPGVGRFRVNVFQQRGSIGMVFRVIPFKVKAIEELLLPESIRKLSDEKRGMILVTGATGSGKSTTLAAIIDKINNEQRSHILTIEDPIEYLHPHKNCLVNQREVGADTSGFKTALRYVLRQDPDVVLIGELRDLETVEAAMTISETGHLALGTLHTNGAVQTVNRIVDIFPPHQQSQIRAQLSFVLEGIISQQLIPHSSGRGRVLVTEVLIPTPAIRNLIREDKVHQIYSQMQVGQGQSGMQTMNQSLYWNLQKGNVTMEDALTHSSDPDELRTMIEQGGGRSGTAPRTATQGAGGRIRYT